MPEEKISNYSIVYEYFNNNFVYSYIYFKVVLMNIFLVTLCISFIFLLPNLFILLLIIDYKYK